MSGIVQKGPDEKFCHECGAVIRAKAEICPSCGVRQFPLNANTGSSAYPSTTNYPEQKRRKSVGAGEAVLWGLFCTPIGFSTWGQSGKGWTWVIITMATFGWGAIPALIDYVMCYTTQQSRDLEPWEIFPTK